MRSPSMNLNFMQYHNVDVFLIFTVCVSSLGFLLFVVFKRVCSKIDYRKYENDKQSKWSDRKSK